VGVHPDVKERYTALVQRLQQLSSVMKPRRVRSSMGSPSKRRRRAVLSIYVRENEDNDTRASYLRKNLRLRIPSITNGSLARSLPFQWNGIEQSIRAGATSRFSGRFHALFRAGISAKRKSGHGRSCGNTHQSLPAGA